MVRSLTEYRNFHNIFLSISFPLSFSTYHISFFSLSLFLSLSHSIPLSLYLSLTLSLLTISISHSLSISPLTAYHFTFFSLFLSAYHISFFYLFLSLSLYFSLTHALSLPLSFFSSYCISMDVFDLVYSKMHIKFIFLYIGTYNTKIYVLAISGLNE